MSGRNGIADAITEPVPNDAITEPGTNDTITDRGADGSSVT